MIIKFYTVPLTRCDCGKPAEFLVMGTGNVEYAKCCAECAPKKMESLSQFWRAQDEETNRNQLEVTRQHV